MALPLPLFPGLEPPSVFSNNVDFSLLLQTSSASLVPASGMDLTGGMNLVDLSAGMVLTNILSKLRIRSDRFYAIVKVVGPCLILAAGTFEFGRHLSFIPIGLRAIGSKLVSCFTASITIPATPSLNDDVCSWVAAQGSGMNSKSLTLCPPKGLDFWQLEQEADILKPLNYTSSFGDSTFLYKGYQMTLTRIEPTTTEGRDGPMKVAPGEIDPTESQNIKLSCFPTFRGAEPIKDFLNHVRGFAKPDLEGLTNIYHHVKSGPSHFWESVTRPSRALEGVVMESKAKDALVADIDFYLSNECRMYYENRGIPYRRGFLLYGPPGTGKTSFATAIAVHFKLPVYIPNLTDLDDKGLEQLFVRLPRRCTLMLEDVDSAGLNREYEEADDSGFNNGSSQNKKKVKSVTLSGLLIALDGPASVDGRVLFMTSNASDSLDAALIRPGRCDKKVLFGYVCPEVSAKLFTNIYTRTADELYKNEQNAADVHDIPAMAEQFAVKIPVDSAITPAECQAWLLSNRLDPVAALEGADQWAKDIIETKLRGANVASFANEIKRIPAVQSDSESDDSDDSDCDDCDEFNNDSNVRFAY